MRSLKIKYLICRYDIDLEYMFPMDQKQCNKTDNSEDMLIPTLASAKRSHIIRRHPLKRKHRRQWISLKSNISPLLWANFINSINNVL